MTSHSPHGQSSLRTVQVLGGGNAGSSAHVRSLAAGLVARGVRVTVCAPTEADSAYDFTGAGAEHVPMPRSSDPGSVAALRAACSDADLVHAHGLHASFRAALALSGRRTPLVVTWHNRAYAEGPRAHLLRVLERRVAKAAAVVLGTSSDLVDRARRRGARDARLAAVALPAPRRATGRDEPRPVQDAGRTRRHGPPVAHGRRLPGPAPGVRRPAGRRTRVASARSRAAPGDRGGGAAAGGAPGPHRGRGAAGPARRAARRRERAARRRRPRAAAQPLGVALRPRPGGPPRARAADRGRRGRRPRAGRGRGRTGALPGRGGARPRPWYGCSGIRERREAPPGAGRPAERHLAHRGRDRRPSAQRLRRVARNRGRSLSGRAQATRPSAHVPAGPERQAQRQDRLRVVQVACPATPRCGRGGCRGSGG